MDGITEVHMDNERNISFAAQAAADREGDRIKEAGYTSAFQQQMVEEAEEKDRRIYGRI